MSQLNSWGFNVHTIVTSNKISPSQKPKNLGCQLQIGVGENFIVEKVPLVMTLGAFKFLSTLKTFDTISIVKVHLVSEVFHTPSYLSMLQ
jgi:N6-adenosine-specific RNA methylase IME4